MTSSFADAPLTTQQFLAVFFRLAYLSSTNKPHKGYDCIDDSFDSLCSGGFSFNCVVLAKTEGKHLFV